MTVHTADAMPAAAGTSHGGPLAATRQWDHAILTRVIVESARGQEQPATFAADAGGARLDAGGAIWRLRSLIAMGHDCTRIARAMKVRAETIRALVRGDVATVSPVFRDLACELWEAWWDKSPPERTWTERRAASAARRRAERSHWPCPLGLDEPDSETGDPGMDAPGYRPWRGWRPATGTGPAPDFHPPGPRARAKGMGAATPAAPGLHGHSLCSSPPGASRDPSGPAGTAAPGGGQHGQRSGSETDEHMSEHTERQMTCPECGENAQEKPPEDLVSWEAHGMTRPGWSHRDGSSLCPVIGPSGGYEPAQPADAAARRGGPDVCPATMDPPAPAGQPDNWDPASRFGPLYDSEGQLIEGPIAPPSGSILSRSDDAGPEPGSFRAAYDQTAGIDAAGRGDAEVAEGAQAVRSISCACDAGPGEPCTPQGDHLARYLQADSSGAISRDQLQAVIARLDVLALQAVVEPAEPEAGQ